MAAPKKQAPAPIDRPLSHAYLREFIGWSTANAPGVSEPHSLRIMENMWITRNRTLAVRPGLRYLSYAAVNEDDDNLKVFSERPVIAEKLVGSQEPFYNKDGEKALLFGVREKDNTVGFRALLESEGSFTVYPLDHPKINFRLPKEPVCFSPKTKYVSYLQIDNKIIALSDAGEPALLFFVGEPKIAKHVNTISVPGWKDSHKLNVIHPNKPWIVKQATAERQNLILNSGFEAGRAQWTISSNAYATPTSTSAPAVHGSSVLVVRSSSTRVNLAISPLHNVNAFGISGWFTSTTYGSPALAKDSNYLRISTTKGRGTFVAYSSLLNGFSGGKTYRVDADIQLGSNVDPRAVFYFYNSAGSMLGNPVFLTVPKVNGIYKSPAVTAPAGTVSARIGFGGVSSTTSQTYVKVRNVFVRPATDTGSFFSGDTAKLPADSADWFLWTGAVNNSVSVYHPPQSVTAVSARVSVPSGKAVVGSIYVKAPGIDLAKIVLKFYDKNSRLVSSITNSANTVANTWVRLVIGSQQIPTTAVSAELWLQVEGIRREEWVQLDCAMLEPYQWSVGDYFDGSTPNTQWNTHKWVTSTKPHQSASVETVKIDPDSVPTTESPTTKTLLALGGAEKNTYKMGFFYTFENEFGESAPSKITEVRMLRPRSNWLWETPDNDGNPSGNITDNANVSCDQLVAILPKDVYDQAVLEGAYRWNLYAFSWSDQEPVPVVGELIGRRDITMDAEENLDNEALTYAHAGWMSITASRTVYSIEVPLPAENNRANYSRPPAARTGLSIADRLILVGDPDDLAAVRWSSNMAGAYTNFTPSVGGGVKTLSTGNINVPGDVVLWQNPQSVDTITVLCLGTDGKSRSYYMMPATVSTQTATTALMGFEETTNTPGTVAAYSAQVINNSLYRPLPHALVKSTAANYNINHMTMTDDIQNMWEALQTKEWIITAELDNRLYLLVNNPKGELLEEGCLGNQIWVYDAAKDSGGWSCLNIQASSIRTIGIGGVTYISVTKPDGLYYLDPYAYQDDVVVEGYIVKKPIAWRFETNVQGGNRAHDAWVRLQQAQITVGNFYGTALFGIRGADTSGNIVDVNKIFSDERPVQDVVARWDVQDFILIRRDMREWTFYGSSVPDKVSTATIQHVLYRYTPISVNVGYEYGSPLTEEYNRNVQYGPDAYSENGIPIPYVDMRRM